jgi:putative ABC transport system substrate-binding protein
MGAVATFDHHLFCQTFSELAYISQPLCHKVRCEFGMVFYIALLLDMNSSGASVVEREKGGKIHIKQAAKRPVIGFLAPAPGAEAWSHLVAAFRRGLVEAGYVEGKNLAIEYRFTNFRPELMTEAAGEVIFAPTPESVAALRNATTSIPVVALDLESDPLAKGYVKSLARPGGNMTGMFLDLPELTGKQVALLKEIVPPLSRVAIFGVPSLNAAQFAATEMTARALALEAETMEVRVAAVRCGA